MPDWLSYFTHRHYATTSPKRPLAMPSSDQEQAQAQAQEQHNAHVEPTNTDTDAGAATSTTASPSINGGLLDLPSEILLQILSCWFRPLCQRPSGTGTWSS